MMMLINWFLQWRYNCHHTQKNAFSEWSFQRSRSLLFLVRSIFFRSLLFFYFLLIFPSVVRMYVARIFFTIPFYDFIPCKLTIAMVCFMKFCVFYATVSKTHRASIFDSQLDFFSLICRRLCVFVCIKICTFEYCWCCVSSFADCTLNGTALDGSVCMVCASMSVCVCVVVKVTHIELTQ